MVSFKRIPITDVEHRSSRKEIPNHPKGVYRLLNDTYEVVYVGKGNIRDRLYRHIVEDLPKRKHHYKFAEYAIVEDPDKLESTLIKDLRPRFNNKDNKRYYQP